MVRVGFRFKQQAFSFGIARRRLRFFGRRPGLEGAVRSFEAAIRADPNFGRAYAGLARALALLSYFGDATMENRVERITTNASRALAIDSTLAEARVALGTLYSAVNQFNRSEEELRHAIALDPNNAEAHFQLGRVLIYYGRLQDATDAFDVVRIHLPQQLRRIRGERFERGAVLLLPERRLDVRLHHVERLDVNMGVNYAHATPHTGTSTQHAHPAPSTQHPAR